VIAGHRAPRALFFFPEIFEKFYGAGVVIVEEGVGLDRKKRDFSACNNKPKSRDTPHREARLFAG
jgi:hypothetical protein